MKNKKILYRWISSDTYSSGSQYINLTDNIEFAKDYWNVILVYELNGENIKEECIQSRKNDVREYDELMKSSWGDGYR